VNTETENLTSLVLLFELEKSACLSSNMYCKTQNMVDSYQIFYCSLAGAMDKLLFQWMKKPLD
jgi:hypothetical protein